MTTYTPKIGSMGEAWMMRDPQGGWVSLADHEEALKQARADRDVLAAETKWYRTIMNDKETQWSAKGWMMDRLGAAINATDASGALDRAKGGGA